MTTSRYARRPPPGMTLRPRYSAATRRSLERIRRSWRMGLITWDAAVKLAERAKGRDRA